MKTKIRVLLVDDHNVVRMGVAAVLAAQPDIEVAGDAPDGETAILRCRELRPDVVLLDLRMPGMGGLQAIKAIRREFPSTRVLAFTSAMGDEDVFRALECGALGYLLKEAGAEELTSAIRATAAGLRTLPVVVVAALDRRLASEPLTAREIDVLKLVAVGRSNREVGKSLGLTEQTVKGYLKIITAKLDVPDRTAAVTLAVQRGLIDVEKLARG